MPLSDRSLAEALSGWGSIDDALIEYLDSLLADPDLTPEDFAALVRAGRSCFRMYANSADHCLDGDNCW